MDPFSLSTGITSLISFTLLVYQQTFTIIGNIKDYPDEFSKLVKNIQEMYQVLCAAGPMINALVVQNPNHPGPFLNLKT